MGRLNQRRTSERVARPVRLPVVETGRVMRHIVVDDRRLAVTGVRLVASLRAAALTRRARVRAGRRSIVAAHATSPDAWPPTIVAVKSLARAIRSLMRHLFSTQAYNQRLETCERQGDNPLTVNQGRVRWFG